MPREYITLCARHTKMSKRVLIREVDDISYAYLKYRRGDLQCETRPRYDVYLVAPVSKRTLYSGLVQCYGTTAWTYVGVDAKPDDLNQIINTCQEAILTLVTSVHATLCEITAPHVQQ